MENKRIFRLLFLNLGFTSLLWQTLLLRELVVSFYGNEFFVGIVLALWLFWTAVGSFLSGKVKVDPRRSLVILHLFISLFFISSIFIIRSFKIPGTTAGEVPDFFASLIFVALILAPVGLTLGSIFTLGTKVWGRASTAYFWETLGFLVAGLAFNFFLVTAPALPRRWEFLTQRWRFPNLVEVENSRYGQIAVTKTGEQYNFYESGLLVGSNRDIPAAEFLVHPVLVHHPGPRRILLIGGGWNGVLAEILKYPAVEKIDYVELDPRFLTLVEKYLSGDLKQAFNDPRVQKHLVDGRYFLKHVNETYDAVLFNLPNPSTALLNRFYTRECFEEVKKIIQPSPLDRLEATPSEVEGSGVFALSLSTPTDYLSEETENLLASVFKTLNQEFPQTKILAEEGVVFLAGDPAPRRVRGEGLEVETKFLTDEELEYRLTSDKNERVQKLLAENETAKINSDFYPAAYFYQTLFWQTKFGFLFPKILAGLQSPGVWGVLGLLLVVVLFARPGLANPMTAAVLAVGLGGLTLMATEIILLFLFQTVLGFVYSKIALLMALILGGVAVGNRLGKKGYKRFKGDKGCKGWLLATQVLIVLYLFFLLKTISLLESEIVFYLLGIMIGVLVGVIFPLASRLVGEGRGGVLYAADLAGSFFGALLPSLFLIPLLGIARTVSLLMVLNLVGIIRQKLRP